MLTRKWHITYYPMGDFWMVWSNDYPTDGIEYQSKDAAQREAYKRNKAIRNA